MLPTLKTGRLILRERTMEDLESCIVMDRDPLKHVGEESFLRYSFKNRTGTFKSHDGL